MIRIPDPGRFELRLMDGSTNPYLLQAGIISAGLFGLENKIDPGEPLSCNMYTDYKNYPNLEKLPNPTAWRILIMPLQVKEKSKGY